MITETPSERPPSTRIASPWLMAAVAAVVVLAVGLGLVLGVALSGSGGPGLAPAAAYVPADAPVYLEARLDLPGEQRDNLRAIVERFPAADADALLTDALAETLDEAMADSGFAYSTDIAPWFEGTVALALLEYPTLGGLAPMPGAEPGGIARPDAIMVAMFGVRDAALAGGFLDRLRAEAEASGATIVSTEVRGVTIWSVEGGLESLAHTAFAYALTDDELLIGTSSDAVTASLDVHAGAGDALADRDEVRQLGAHLPDEASGVMTINLGAMLDEIRASLEGEAPELGAVYDEMLAGVPTFAMGSLAFESDAARVDTAFTTPDAGPALGTGTRSLAEQVPGDALLFVDGGDVGERLSAGIESMRGALEAAGVDEEALGQVESALGASLSEFVSWIGDGAVVAGFEGDEPYVGAVLEAIDADAARERMGQLRGLIGLAASDPSTGVTIESETVSGAEVTTVRVAISDAMGEVLLDGSAAEIVLQWAVDDERVIIGSGDRFVVRVLGLSTNDSLGASDRFEAAQQRMGASNAGFAFVDLAGLRETVVSLLPAEAGIGYDMVASWVAPLDYLSAVTLVEGDVTVQRTLLVVR